MAAVRYREYRPCTALRDSVRAVFTFAPTGPNDSPAPGMTRELLFEAGDPFCSPLFAHSHASLVFSFPRICRADGVWRAGAARPHANVIGPMTRVGPASLDERTEMLGVYLRATGVAPIARTPATSLTDRIVALDDLWGASATALAADLCGLDRDAARIWNLESALLDSMACSPTPPANLDISSLAALILRHRGRLNVQHLAEAAGVSRQHLTRAFRDAVGVTPKLYCRLARFHASLRYAYHGSPVSWADAAIAMGYSDQSHMIAEFREFSGLTPPALALQRTFHPFIETSVREPRA